MSTKKFSKQEIAEAETLLNGIREGLINVEKNLIELVKIRGWERLGYKTFSEMWSDRLEGIALARHMAKAHVAWALFAEEMPDEDIHALLGGTIGMQALKYMREQHSRGVPADLATVVPPRQPIPTPALDQHVVESFVRRNRGEASTVHVHLSSDQYAKLNAYAKTDKKSASDLAKVAVEHYLVMRAYNVDVDEKTA